MMRQPRNALARWLLAAALRLVPRSLRDRVHGEIMDDAMRRMNQQPLRRRRLTILVAELGGIVSVALRARFPDEWVRRTEPASMTTYDDSALDRPLPKGEIVNQLIGDVRFALRTFRRRKLMFGVATASLALGIGASVAMFSIVNSVLLVPLPYARPGELVAIYPTDTSMRNHPTLSELADRGTFALPEFWDVREFQRAFQDVGMFAAGSGMVTRGGESEQVNIGRASSSLFAMLGVQPVAGSLFPASADAQTDKIVLLGYDFWQKRYAGRSNVVGTTIDIDDQPWTIVGVLPRSAEIGTMSPALWTPRARRAADEQTRGNHWLGGAIGRLKPGVTVAVARADVAQILANTAVSGHTKHGAAVYDLQDDLIHGVRPALVILLAAAALLLVVGCANVAAILLGAGLDRTQEVAIRGALGAGHGRLTRQLLTESVVLAATGGVIGIGLGAAGLKLLRWIAPPGIPRIDDATLDLRVLAVALALAIVSALLFGTLPALSLARRAMSASLTSTRVIGGRMGRAQRAVVVGELALATVLLVGGALLVRTLRALNTVDTGIATTELLAVRVAPPFQRFQKTTGDTTEQGIDSYFQRFTDAIATVPGVRGVAVTSVLPLTGDRNNNSVEPEGWTASSNESLVAERRFVSSNYFQVAGIRMVEGRAFGTEDDRQDGPKVMVISEGLARKAWPGQPAVGKHVTYWGSRTATVVGVAANLRDQGLRSSTDLAFYVPYRQYGSQTGGLLVRTRGDPSRLVASIRGRILEVDKAAAIPNITPYETLITRETMSARYRTRLMLTFALLAAVFAAIGVFGVTAGSVSRRTREIGIRVAIGAAPSTVLSMVLMQGVRMAAIGVAIGVAASLATGRFMERLLFGVHATDPASLAAIAAIVLVVAIGAALPPGRRATAVSPMEALRSE
jgi:putative ABC transport system permease protein